VTCEEKLETRRQKVEIGKAESEKAETRNWKPEEN
jgi:exonuclease VII small subunit